MSTAQEHPLVCREKWEVPYDVEMMIAPFNLAQARDGASHTILIVETNLDQAVIWTKPDDWKVDAKKPHTGVVREKGKGFHALFADAAVHLMDDGMSAENLLLLLGRDDGKNAPTKSLFLKEELKKE